VTREEGKEKGGREERERRTLPPHLSPRHPEGGKRGRK